MEQPKNKEPEQQDLFLSFNIPGNNFKHWKKCSLIADFFGNYIAESYTGTKEKISSIISTIANELIENATKFNINDNNNIHVSIKKEKENIIINTKNNTTKENIMKLKNTLEQIDSNDIHTLQLLRISQHAKNQNNESEIGIINLVKDYDVSINTSILPLNDERFYEVSITVTINLEPLLQ